MIPREILGRLSQLRQRERAIRLVWGLACLAAVVFAVVLFGCLVDYAWDRTQETPTIVRAALLCLTGLAVVAGGLVWVLAPQFQHLHDDELALMVEGKHPKFRNRLISAVQLNRPNAAKQGMSDELIGVMTKEAESQSQEVSFPSATDHGRISQGFKYLIPVAAVCLLLLLWKPALGGILLARHFMANVDIPRLTKIEPESAQALVYPAGEAVKLRFHVRGEGFDENSEGTCSVTPAGQPTDRYKLKFAEVIDDPNKPGEKVSVFAADIAPSSLSMKYNARLEDGRTKGVSEVKMVQRPVVIEQSAFTVLPAYCGLFNNKDRYEVPQVRGDVAGILGSDVKVVAKIQKPVSGVMVEALRTEKGEDPVAPPTERVLRKINCTLDESKTGAKCSFPIASDVPVESATWAAGLVTIKTKNDAGVVFSPGQSVSISGMTPAAYNGTHAVVSANAKDHTFTYKLQTAPGNATALGSVDFGPYDGYRIVAWDEYGFKNDPPPRRNLRVVPEEPPSVTILKDYFTPAGSIGAKQSLEDFHIDGVPVPIGGSLRVPYLAEGTYGLGKVYLLYRVLRKTESGQDVPLEDPWNRLELTEIAPNEIPKDSGPFDTRRGVFEKTPVTKSIGFYAEPSYDPNRLGRTVGGGRFHLKTNGLVDSKGRPVKLQEGDKIEYCLEVFADKRADSGRPTARSETRVQSMGSIADVTKTIENIAQEERRLREIERLQIILFGSQIMFRPEFADEIAPNEKKTGIPGR